MRRSYILALTFAAIVIGWVASGQFDEDTQLEDQVATSTHTDNAFAKKYDKPIQVRVSQRTAKIQTRHLILRGQTEANRWVDVKAETKGRVTEVIAKEGARVERAEPIVKLAMEGRSAKLSQAKARVRQRQIEFDAAKSLRQKGFRAKTKTAESAAQLEEAIARVADISIDIDHTEVRAPFAGIIDTRYVELGDFVRPGDAIARIVDENPYLVVGHVSERDVGKIALGDAGTALLANGDSVSGKVRYIATVADVSTRTFRVELEIPNTGNKLRSGITANIRIPVESVHAHFVSPALLTLDDNGILGIRTIDQSSIVAFKPVSIFATQPDGIWITGLPKTITLITVGQEFVRHGELVIPVTDDRRAQ